MKYVLLSIFLLISSKMLGQEEFCHPKIIERAAKKIIGKLSKEDFLAVMRITKDSVVDNQLFFWFTREVKDN